MKCIGKIIAMYNYRNTLFQWRPNVYIKWFEKY